MPLKTTLAYILIAITSAVASAGEFVDFGKLETSNMRFISPTECRVEYAKANFSKKYAVPNIVETLNKLGEAPTPMGILGWVPTGSPTRLEPKGCDPIELEHDMLRARKSATLQSEVLRNYFQRCDSGLRQDAAPDVLALLGLAGAHYDGCENPNIRKVLIRVAGGETLRGILAVKADATPRPLVILKCGLFCNSADLAHALVFMHLYDESPFNVMVVANGASADFARDNDRIAVGGFEEGRQLLEIINLIRTGPMAKRTSSIHLMGISLGSHASLYASYLAQHNSKKGDIPLSSTLATCPVVDLESSIASLFAPNFKGKLAETVLNTELAKVIDSVPSLINILPSSAKGNLPQKIAESCVDHLSHQSNFPSPFEKSVIRTTGDYWQINNYVQLVSRESVKSPTLLLAANDDTVVPARSNTGVMISALNYMRQNNPSLVANGNLAAVTLPSGNHCAFSITYGWRSMSAVYRGYVLSHSPEMLKRRKVRSLAIPQDVFAKDSHLWPQEAHQLTTFEFHKGRPSLTVIFHAFQGYSAECAEKGIREAGLSCFRAAVIEIPFARFSSRPSWAMRAPLSDAEAQSLTRWANVNLKAYDAQGGSLVNTSNDAAVLSWETYD